jgi:Homeodomain-like domain-containing protein
MSGHGAVNATKREQIALLLAAGRSAKQVAATAGVGERTIRRWLAKDPIFAARVNQLRAGLFKRSGGVLAQSTTRAAHRLSQLVKSEDDRVALAAARSVIGLTRTVQEAVEFEERLAAIEKRLRTKGAKL